MAQLKLTSYVVLATYTAVTGIPFNSDYKCREINMVNTLLDLFKSQKEVITKTYIDLVSLIQVHFYCALILLINNA